MAWVSSPLCVPRLDVHACLSDYRRYERQIERLHLHYLSTGHLYELEQDGVSLASVVLNKSRFARLLAKSVECGEYGFEPARVRTIRVDGKKRVVYLLRLTDLVVHGVVADLIAEAMAPALHGGLYSYRKGISWWTAVSDFAAYVRHHRRSRPDPKTRGLCVLRRDIDSYTDSIPVGSKSPVWEMLRDLLGEPLPKGSVRQTDWAVIEQVVRPEAYRIAHSRFSLFRGVPTGQPISCVLFNLYLQPVDQQLASIPGAFYARYSDDIRFAHPDPRIVQAADSQLEAIVAQLGLKINRAKSQDFYLTCAGRRSAQWPDAKPATWIPFLGCRISAHGTVSLNRSKGRSLLRDLRRRAFQTAKLLGKKSLRVRGQTVCAVVNQALDPRHNVFQQRWATLVRRAVTDRHQLRQIDHWIARIVVQAVTGRDGVRAFRAVSYRTLRREWNLVSVVHARNRWPRTVTR